MPEIKWDIKRGADIYRQVSDARLRGWISTGKIKSGEAVVWRSGFSGWRKPEELEELKVCFTQWNEKQLIIKVKTPEKRIPFLREIKNILIIDDEKDLCSLLSDALRERMFNVSIANTIKEATAHLDREMSDAVFLDLKLPDGNGMDILSQIKKMHPETIVFIISAYGSEETREEASEKGAYAFIDKPFTDDEILRNIDKVNSIPAPY
jgi:CheY-like chemotaxis protein